jgi:hypothetical protein
MVLSRPGQVLVALLRGCGIMEPSNEQRSSMYLNFKGQVEVKVKKGQKDQLVEDITDAMAELVNRTIQNFLLEQGQNPEGF